MTATAPEADFVVSACEIAFTTTDAGFGRVDGAAYKPPGVIVPTAEFPPVTLFTCHVTAVFDVPVTVAVYCRVAEVRTAALVGVIETFTAVEYVTKTAS